MTEQPPLSASSDRWLLLDTSVAGAVECAWTNAGELHLRDRITLDAAPFPTFTDALMSYQRGAKLDLARMRCAVVVAGPAHIGNISIARTRWTLSRSGLSIFFAKPVTFINDAAALAWSLLWPGSLPMRAIDNGGAAHFRSMGRWAVLLIDDGVGAAVLDVDANDHVKVLDSELGHTGFSPVDTQEAEFLDRVRRDHRRGSWEAILTLPIRDDAWPLLADGTQDLITRVWPALAANYAAEATLALAAWSGVVFAGRQSIALARSPAVTAFDNRLSLYRLHGRSITSVRRFLLQKRLCLEGAAACLSVLNT